MQASLAGMLRWLVLPWGSVSGQRIVLDSVQGRILVYNASNALVAEINTDGQFVAYDTDSDETRAVLSAGEISFAVQFFDYDDIPRIRHQTAAGAQSSIRMSSGSYGGAPGYYDASMYLLSSGPGIADWPLMLVRSDNEPDNRADLAVTGVMQAGNMAFGSVVITPVAGSPTSVAVIGLDVKGTSFYGFASANSSALAVVSEVSATNASSSGVTVWIMSSSATNRTVNWMVMGSG